ncbi:MAG: glycosyltransferase family 39 protein [Oleispira sp.]|nr:glycosyltransferase family 39 protein [Oleispira sp.]
MPLKTVSIISIAIFALLALLHSWLLPFSADEAHYALYGKLLDWSYFDHPPMVGWLQSISLLWGESELALRILPILLSALSLGLLFKLSREEFGEKTALLTLLLFISAPILQILPFGMIPETPLILCGLLNIWILKRLIKNNGETLSDWLLLGLILGAAGLSKYTGITLAFSTFIALYIHFKMSLTRQFGFYLAGAIAGLCIIPIIYWNINNDWISILYQLNHSAGKAEYSLLAASTMQVTQLASYGPLLYILGLVVIITQLKSKLNNKLNNKQINLWLIFALPILILFSFLSAKGRSLPHWTELGVIFMMPLIAQFILASWGKKSKNKGKKTLIISLASLTLLLTLVVQVLLTVPKIQFDDYSHPLADLKGWKEISQQMQQQAQPGDSIFIPNWSHASRVAWYARPLPVKVLDTRFDQFDLWFGSAEAGDSGLVLLNASRKGFKEKSLKKFEHCEFSSELEIKIESSMVNHFKVYRCSNYLDAINK